MSKSSSTRLRRVILHGLRDENGVSYRLIDQRTRDFVVACPLGCNKEQALVFARSQDGLYFHTYEEEEG